MKEIPAKLIEFSFIFLIIIVFLFLFVNCKIENVQLKTKYDILNERVTDLDKELIGIRQVYSQMFVTLINRNKISLEDLSQQLPEHEYKYLQMVIMTQEKVRNEE